MEPLSRLALEWMPFQITKDGKVIVDVFKHSLSATDGLPPYTQARIIDLISLQLKKTRQHPALWVSVDSPGNWYVQELQRLVRRKIPTAILPVNEVPEDVWGFKPHAVPHHVDPTENLCVDHPFRLENYGLKTSSLRLLRILARLKSAHTPEITSLAGFSETHARNLLRQLQAERLIEQKQVGKYLGWGIRNKGLRLAHRSWNVPKGSHFAKDRGEFRYAGERHRRVARMWRAWLETAYPNVEIWECWTEVPVRYGIPDALAWGTHRGQEMLFWLEVDSGHSSRNTMEANYSRRLELVYAHAARWYMPIVFCILGLPWVVDAFRWCFPNMNSWVAVIGHDWREFGKLPDYEFGRWHEDLDASSCRRESQRGGKLPFESSQYKVRRKRVKGQKVPKPKCTKPRFSKDSEEEYHPSGEFEREK